MTNIGQTVVTITIETYSKMLERAASLGIEAGTKSITDTATVELTAKSIAGALIYETALSGQLKPAPSPPLYRGDRHTP